MFDYNGETCRYCEKQFQAGEDIVVCPECGAPHHRECYTEQGACAYAERHETGFDWLDERQTRKAETEAADSIPCPQCGRSVAEESRFCNFCGAQFASAPGSAGPQEASQPLMIFNLQTASAKTDVKEIDGIPVADWLKYIGRNASYYLSRFSYQNMTGRKTWFTLSAALFPPVYFFYRKMWWWAILASVLNVGLSLPTIALSLSNAGFHLGFDLAILTLWENYLSYAAWGVNLAFGLFAMYFYRLSAARRIRRIKLRSASEQDYQGWLDRVSGPSLVAALLPFAAGLLGTALLNVLGLA